MPNQRHIIKKQVLEITIDGREKAGQAQEKFKQLFQEHLLPAISAVFDQISPDGELHRIDRLEIDLGEVDLSVAGDQIPEHFKVLFQHALEEKIAKIKPHPQATQSADPGTRIEVLLHFLDTGHLPWWASASGPDTLEGLFEAFTQLPKVEMARILGDILRLDRRKKRFLRHLEGKHLEALIGKLSPSKEIWSTFSQWQKIVPAIAMEGGFQKNTLRLQSVEGLLHFLRSSAPSDIDSVRMLEFLLLHTTPAGVPHSRFREQLSHHIRDKQAEQPGLAQLFRQIGPTPAPPQSTEPEKNEKGEALTPETRKFHHSEEIYLHNAGLVILAPFLPSLFQHLGWLDEREFKGEGEKYRACQLLQYLVDSSNEAPEFQLPLNKLLCGLSLEEPIETEVLLTQEEQEEGDALLRAAIGHASILRDMSIDGFRNTFLRREGLLKDQNDYWLLRVSRETYDIVLDQFPWSFQTIKLPWMERAIYVEW